MWPLTLRSGKCYTFKNIVGDHSLSLMSCTEQVSAGAKYTEGTGVHPSNDCDLLGYTCH